MQFFNTNLEGFQTLVVALVECVGSWQFSNMSDGICNVFFVTVGFNAPMSLE